MNPGPLDDAGKVATGIVDSLKAQPAVMALTLANLSLLIFMYYGLSGAATSRELIIKQVLDNSNFIHTLLQQRAVSCPDVTPKFNLQSDELKPAELPEPPK
jgi:hypothetical protein